MKAVLCFALLGFAALQMAAATSDYKQAPVAYAPYQTGYQQVVVVYKPEKKETIKDKIKAKVEDIKAKVEDFKDELKCKKAQKKVDEAAKKLQAAKNKLGEKVDFAGKVYQKIAEKDAKKAKDSYGYGYAPAPVKQEKGIVAKLSDKMVEAAYKKVDDAAEKYADAMYKMKQACGQPVVYKPAPAGY